MSGAADQARDDYSVPRPSRRRRQWRPPSEGGWSFASTRLPAARLPRPGQQARFRRCAALRRREDAEDEQETHPRARRRSNRGRRSRHGPLFVPARGPKAGGLWAAVRGGHEKLSRLTRTRLSDLFLSYVAVQVLEVKSCTNHKPKRPALSRRGIRTNGGSTAHRLAPAVLPRRSLMVLLDLTAGEHRIAAHRRRLRLSARRSAGRSTTTR